MRHSNEDDKWLEALRRQLDDYRTEPSADLWQRIEQKLEAPATVRQARVVPLWQKAVAAAAAIAVLGGGGWLWLSRHASPDAALSPDKVALTAGRVPARQVPSSQAGGKSSVSAAANKVSASVRDEASGRVYSAALLAERKVVSSATDVSASASSVTDVSASASSEPALMSAYTAALSNAPDMAYSADDKASAENMTTLSDHTSSMKENVNSLKEDTNTGTERKDYNKDNRDNRDNNDNKDNSDNNDNKDNNAPKNWYDNLPAADRMLQAAQFQENSGHKWTVSLTAMNGLPSAGGNTTGGGHVLMPADYAVQQTGPLDNSNKVMMNTLQPSYGTLLMGTQTRTIPTTVTARHKIPVSYGLSFRYNLTPQWGLESGVSYTVLGTDFQTEGASGNSSYSQSLRYMELPVRATFTFLQHRWYSVYAAAGGAVAKCISARVTESDGTDRTLDEKPWQVSANAAAGIQLNFLKYAGLYLEPGIGYYFNDGSSLRTVYKDHPWVFRLNFGLRISW